MKCFIVFIFLTFAGLTNASVSHDLADIAESWGDNAKAFEVEQEYLNEIKLKSRADLDLLSVSRGQSNSALMRSKVLGLDLVRRLAWAERIPEMGLKFAPEEFKEIKDPKQLDVALWSHLRYRVPKFFHLSSLEAGLAIRREFQKILKILPSGFSQTAEHSEWWKWFSAPDSVALKTEFTGFNESDDPLLLAWAYYLSSLQTSGNSSLRLIVLARYCLNSQTSSRKYLGDFDSEVLRREFKLNKSSMNSDYFMRFINSDARSYLDQKSALLGVLLAEVKKENNFKLGEIVLTHQIQLHDEIGTQVSISDLKELAELRLRLGQDDESFQVIRRIQSFVASDAELAQHPFWKSWINVSLAKASNNLAKRLREPDRRDAMKWEQYYYEMALMEGSFNSTERDSILESYALLLNRLGLKAHAAEAWERLFKTGLTSDGRKMGLQNLIQTFPQRLGVIPPSHQADVFFQMLSLSGFFAKAYPFDPSIKSMASHIRIWRRRLNLLEDPVVAASLLEIEKLAVRKK